MRTYISLGSNLGERERYIKEAIRILGAGVKDVSDIVETEPVGMETDKKFLNAIIEFDTKLGPFALLDMLEDIEKKLGREGKGNKKPRTIDLDILEYGGMKIDSPRLVIPHPAIKEREFLCTLSKTLKEKKEKKK